mgnify:CR=1 FL=1|jgi:hypothetical protein
MSLLLVDVSSSLLILSLLLEQIGAGTCPVEVGLVCRGCSGADLGRSSEHLEPTSFLLVETGDEKADPLARVLLVFIVEAAGCCFAGILGVVCRGWAGNAGACIE